MKRNSKRKCSFRELYSAYAVVEVQQTAHFELAVELLLKTAVYLRYRYQVGFVLKDQANESGTAD